MSKCWYCNKEIRSGNNPQHLGICDKCYDEMFKAGNDFINKFTIKIADLEAKLAESEEQLNNSEQMCLICNKDQENEQLKQQLTDTEAQNKRVLEKLELIVSDNQDLQRQLAEKEKEIFFYQIAIKENPKQQPKCVNF